MTMTKQHQRERKKDFQSAEDTPPQTLKNMKTAGLLALRSMLLNDLPTLECAVVAYVKQLADYSCGGSFGFS